MRLGTARQCAYGGQRQQSGGEIESSGKTSVRQKNQGRPADRASERGGFVNMNTGQIYKQAWMLREFR